METNENTFRCHLSSGRHLAGTALHFNRLIPRLHLPNGPFSFSNPIIPVNTSPRKRQAIAVRLAKLNAGRSPIEMVKPVEVISSLLTSWNEIDGLVGIQQVNGYVLEFEAGMLFDWVDIGRKIAVAMHEHLFSSLELEYSIEASLQQTDPHGEGPMTPGIRARRFDPTQI